MPPPATAVAVLVPDEEPPLEAAGDGCVKKLWSALCVLTLLVPAVALADGPRDRVRFGEDVHVGAGEVVNDAVSFGGDVVVEGEVLGDAVSFGGGVDLREGGAVRGDTVTFGGDVRGAQRAEGDAVSFGGDASHVDAGPLGGFWDWLGESVRSFVAHVLLFLLGPLLLGPFRERLRAMQATMITDGLKTAGTGLLGYVIAGVAIVVLAITIVGIPAAVVLGLALPVATYVGLAAAATVIGAALPFEGLRGQEVLQLALGVGVLYVASIVPTVGSLATIAFACLGLGALIRTRFRTEPPADLPASGGPYRTQAADA
ncbi:MAG: hypothetical protein VYE22_17155 [Myxococcota bacterium]|nr:hypothetical protein [Myxococcota bacterium]